jgi:hypothetical protein
MKTAAMRLNPIVAFVCTIALGVVYFGTVLAITHPTGVQASRIGGAMHVVLIWAPLIVSGSFYAWLSRSAAVSPSRRIAQVAAATVLAPIIAASIVGLAGLELLRWSM